MSIEKLKWGILGPGKISNKFAKDLSLVEGAILTAVASRSLERSQTFAEAYKVENAYGDYESLFNDPNVDIIYIGTPHNSHRDYAIMAMNAGKHVLCEKPLAVNKLQVQEMLNAAKRNKVFLMEAFWSRFNPSIVEVLDQIESGAIGDVNYVNADFTFYRDAPAESRMFNMDLAGGSLLDVGVYPIFLSYVIFGYPDQILATARLHETGADLHTSAILKYENGIASLNSGFASQSDMIAKIYGTDGSIMIDHVWHETQGYKLIKNGVVCQFNHPTKGKGFSYEIEECIDCISKGLLESPKWTHRNSLDLISITDEIRGQIGLKYPFE